MSKVKLTIQESNCRCHYLTEGDSFIVGDLCPPICHELWHYAYPFVYALLNNGKLDYGDTKASKASVKCPDNGRVSMIIEKIEDEK